MSNSRVQSLMPSRQTEIDLLAWLGQATVGDIVEYHQGFLALDRSSCGDPRSGHDRMALGRVAICALRLADRGFVHLIQRRLCSDRFSYLAVARPRVKSIPLSLMTHESEEVV
jgi:hypothetical protein